MAEIVVPFAEFVPVRRGRMVSGHPPLHPDRITTVGLIISRQEGPFWLDDEDGSPTEEVQIEAVLTNVIRHVHWRVLEDISRWCIGWR